MKKLKKQAYEFLKQFKITELNVHALSKAIEAQGYTIVKYSRIYNSEDVEQLLDALGVKALSLTTGAFTYAGKNHRIVFLEEGHSEEEELVLLAHEEGHIFCGHMKSMSGICGEEVMNEYEANTFAHYILKNSLFRSICVTLSIHKIKAIVCGIILFLVVALAFGVISYSALTANAGEYCRTRSGSRYHLPGCDTIQGYKVTYNTAENFERIGVTPCSVCLGD